MQWGRYTRGRLLRDGIDIDELDDAGVALDLIESLAIDMFSGSVVSVLAPKLLDDETPKRDWPGWFAHIAEPPTVMCDDGPVQLGVTLAHSVESWGIQLDDFDEPEPAPLRVVLPDQPGSAI